MVTNTAKETSINQVDLPLKFSWSAASCCRTRGIVYVIARADRLYKQATFLLMMSTVAQ